MIKKVLFFILCIISFIGVKADDLTENAKSAILIEASTGKVLYEKNADEALAPASMTKMMTLLLTMEAIEKGTIKLDDKVNVSENAANMGGSQVYLAANTEYKLEEIIKAVCIASGNDAAVVLAEAIAGSTGKFVEMMNKKSRDLGLTATNFVNVYGLDADGHLSSARDMALIAKELVKHDLILKYSSIYEEYLNKPDGSNLWMVNTNKLVRYYSGIDGLKTGYTNKAGFCLTATGMWNDMRLISVVMGEPTQDSRNAETVALLNYGRNAYKINKILNKNDTIGKIKVDLSKYGEYEITIMEDVKDLVGKNDEDINYTYEIKTNNQYAPLKVGDKVGTVDIYFNGEKQMTKDLTVKDNIPKISYFSVIKKIISLLILGNV